ncbi:MAG: thioredoxin fold domain-containing protein [Bacteroidota bacterium]
MPVNYKNIPAGQLINFTSTLNKITGKPLYLHFYNPACPCSRFYTSTFKNLAKRYGTKIDFVVIVVSQDNYSIKAIQHEFGTGVSIIADQSIAKVCGVYSIPQVVLLNKDHRLYFRGDYNRARFCNDEKNNYANIAINKLLYAKTNLEFKSNASKSYGCALLGCTLKHPVNHGTHGLKLYL